MEDSMFVYGFLNGSESIVVAARNANDAANVALGVITEPYGPFSSMNYCHIGWGKDIMAGHSATIN